MSKNPSLYGFDITKNDFGLTDIKVLPLMHIASNQTPEQLVIQHILNNTKRLTEGHNGVRSKEEKFKSNLQY